MIFAVLSSTCLESKSESVLVTQSCLTLCDPMDCSLPGSFAHGVLQARRLEWVAIAFSGVVGRKCKLIPGLCVNSIQYVSLPVSEYKWLVGLLSGWWHAGTSLSESAAVMLDI